MDREVENVFRDMPGNNCFACHPDNPHGLRLRFFADDEAGEVYTRIKPERYFAGFPGVLHGGIQCALLDEVALWAMFDRVGKLGLTTKVQLQYLKAVSSNVELKVRGKVSKISDRFVVVDTVIINHNGEECTKGQITYYLPVKEVLFGIMGEEKFSQHLMQYIKD